MRLATILSAAVILTITTSMASAQGRTYGGGGGGSSSGGSAVSNGGSHQHGGMTFSGGSSGGGAVINGGPATSTPSNNGPASRSFPSTPQAAGNRPTFTIDGRRHDRDNDAREDERERHRHGGLRNHPIYYPYYGYPYGADYSTDATDYNNQQQQTANQYAEPEAPAPTIFENRPGYTPPPIRPAEPAAAAPAATKPNLSASEPEPITILVFRDGHEIEIGNYAIMGNTLYNLDGDYRTHKILLSDLDLDKTVKVNEARGYQFRLPRQQGS